EPQGRHLRRAWRRSGLGGVLPPDRARLCLVLALSRADRAPRRRASRARQDNREPGVSLSAVIARSESDEAIHLSSRGSMDCFASLAMTWIERPLLIRPPIPLHYFR